MVKHSDNYSATSWILWEYYRNELVLDANSAITNFRTASNNSAWFKSITTMNVKTVTSGTKDETFWSTSKKQDNIRKKTRVKEMVTRLGFY